MTHSPEPWAISKPFPGESGGKCVEITGIHAHYYRGVDWNTDEEKVNAARIVACVNACCGWTTEELVNHTFLKTGTLSDSGRDVAHLAHIVR